MAVFPRRIYLRDTPSIYLPSLLTVTAAAPYLALRVLDQLVKDEGSEFPLAVPVLHHQTYVDECAFGADDKVLAGPIN